MTADRALAAFARLGPGARVARYTIVRAGGVGGMAAVWMARDGATGDLVALKTMLPAFSMRPEHEKMFLAEGRLASRIQHPNICRVRDVGEDAGIQYIVMDWVHGGSLAALMAAHGRALPHGVAARIVADVARGLEAVHDAHGDDGAPLGIVHRDVSPQNVLVSHDGRATIADFGVAKIADGDGDGTASGFVKGKVRYMAPEQAYAEPVDARTDVFALGLVLCEATTGQHPFAAQSDVATLARIASGDPVPLPGDEGYPDVLRAIVARAVEHEASARFASMGALADALDAFDDAREGGPTTREEIARFVRAALPPRTEAAAMPRPPAGSNKVRLALGFLLVSALGYGAWHGLRGPPVIAPAEARPTVAPLLAAAEPPASAPASASEAVIPVLAPPPPSAARTPARGPVAIAPARARETPPATSASAAPSSAPVVAPAASSAPGRRDVLRSRD